MQRSSGEKKKPTSRILFVTSCHSSVHYFFHPRAPRRGMEERPSLSCSLLQDPLKLTHPSLKRAGAPLFKVMDGAVGPAGAAAPAVMDVSERVFLDCCLQPIWALRGAGIVSGPNLFIINCNDPATIRLSLPLLPPSSLIVMQSSTKALSSLIYAALLPSSRVKVRQRESTLRARSSKTIVKKKMKSLTILGLWRSFKR